LVIAVLNKVLNPTLLKNKFGLQLHLLLNDCLIPSFLPSCMHCMQHGLATRKMSVHLSVCLMIWQN